MSRNWEKERWRKLYIVEPIDQQAWSWKVRGLRDLLIRMASDDGHLTKSRAALITVLRGDQELDDAIGILLEDGFLIESPNGISVRNLAEAQGTSRPGPLPKTSLGGWSGKSPEERTAAARRAAQARWRRNPTDAATHPTDASRTQETTHSDAPSDACHDAPSPRAISGQDHSTEGIFKPDGADSQICARTELHASDACSSTHASSTAATQKTLELRQSPSNFAEALSIPIRIRAELALERPDLANWVRAHDWPEIVEAARIMSAALGLAPPKLARERDSAVKALLTLFAAGYTPDEFLAASQIAKVSPYRSKIRGLDGLTPTVMRRFFDENVRETAGVQEAIVTP